MLKYELELVSFQDKIFEHQLVFQSVMVHAVILSTAKHQLRRHLFMTMLKLQQY